MMSKWAARMIMFKWGPEVGVVRTNQKKTSEEVHPRNLLGGGNSKILEFSVRKLGKNEPNLTSIFFQMGWFNHIPV